MPYRDQTGPEGLGPLTGRGAGICSDRDSGLTNRPLRMFWRIGRGLFNRYGWIGRPRYGRFPRLGRGRNRRY
jgi:hypothetical protein